MSEYNEYIVSLSGDWAHKADEKLTEIVRCMDCRWYDDRFHYPLCRRDMSCDEIAVSVEPDGFCAWGERREQ